MDGQCRRKVDDMKWHLHDLIISQSLIKYQRYALDPICYTAVTSACCRDCVCAIANAAE